MDLTAKEVRQILESIGASPSKKRGQNFLVEPSQTALIAQAVLAHPNPLIVEIGPGLGSLTRRLVESGRDVFALELDRAFCRYLAEYFAAAPNFHLLEGDALDAMAEWGRADSFPLAASVPFFCGNLPYSITTDLLRATAGISWVPGAVYLTQLEFAERITSDSSISSFAVYLGCFGSWKRLRTVGKSAFFPAPSVESALIEFRREPLRCDPGVLEDLLRSSFFSKRKKVSNSWKSAAGLRGLSPEEIFSAAEACGVSPDLRPEQIPREKYYEMARELRADSR